MNSAETRPAIAPRPAYASKHNRLGHDKERRLQRRDGKRRMRSEEELANVGGGRRRGEHRHQRPRADLVQDDFDRKQHAAHRRIKRCADSASRSRGDQGDPLPCRQPQQLAESRAKGGADLDDGPFAADGRAAADRKGRSQSFDHRYHRANDSLAVIDGIHHLRNAVTLGFRSEILHQKCHAQRAGDRHQNDKWAPRTGRRMNVCVVRRGELSEKQQIVNQADECPECDGSQPGNYAHQDRECPQGRRIQRPRVYRSRSLWMHGSPWPFRRISLLNWSNLLDLKQPSRSTARPFPGNSAALCRLTFSFGALIGFHFPSFHLRTDPSPGTQKANPDGSRGDALL